jgi:hypothetical protein
MRKAAAWGNVALCASFRRLGLAWPPGRILNHQAFLRAAAFPSAAQDIRCGDFGR